MSQVKSTVWATGVAASPAVRPPTMPVSGSRAPSTRTDGSTVQTSAVESPSSYRTTTRPSRPSTAAAPSTGGSFPIFPVASAGGVWAPTIERRTVAARRALPPRSSRQAQTRSYSTPSGDVASGGVIPTRRPPATVPPSPRLTTATSVAVTKRAAAPSGSAPAAASSRYSRTAATGSLSASASRIRTVCAVASPRGSSTISASGGALAGATPPPPPEPFPATTAATVAPT